MTLSQYAVPTDEVLIAGAGPTGLFLGIELRVRGVRCRVIDARPGPLLATRSFTLQPRTIEHFRQSGYAEDFHNIALRSQGLAIHFRHADTQYVDFTTLDTPEPRILIVGQNDVEAILRERFEALGGTIEWNTQLQDLATDPDGRITALLHHKTSSGRGLETLHPDWLVGCDGIRSMVRNHIGAEFAGIEYTGMRMRMMDVDVTNPYPGSSHWIDYWVDEKCMLLMRELRDGYRVLISDMSPDFRASTRPDPEAARATFQQVVSSWLPQTTLGTPKWASQFFIWRRLASAYRKGRILVAGDAAHVNSPAAGMGMNTCLQDAANLGWKLAAVASGRAPAELLDTYQDERRPIATQVADAADLLHEIMMAHGKSVESRLELFHREGFHHEVAERVAGLTHTYRDVITQQQSLGLPPLAGLTAGDRAPDVALTPALRLHDLLAHPGHTLLALQRDPTSPLAGQVAAVTSPSNDLLRTAVITPPGTNSPHAITARNAEVFRRYGLPDRDTLCLIRPDGHIGLRWQASDDPHSLAATLGTVALT